MTSLLNPNFPPGFQQIPAHDRRNVIDHYKFVADELIKGDLDSKRTELVLIAENWGYDFNLGTLVRNSNAFVAKCVYIVGRRSYDRRGTVGTHKYEHIQYKTTLEPLVSDLKSEGYQIVVMDNIEGAGSIQAHTWVSKTAIIFGQEGLGVSPEALALSDHVVYIPQLGSVRSLNVGTSSGIAIYDYMLKTGGFTNA
jgi:tRNA G18 (ribose-2'-O)-methylase SpoU